MKEYEVVISGMAGRFPECDTVEELQTNLMNKKDLITDDDRRWNKASYLPEIPHQTGKIRERDEMDQTYFGIHRRLCEVTDPHHRICLELAFSAIIDAGINPWDLWGTNTAVITNSVTSDTEYDCLLDIRKVGVSILGHSRSMQSNRISYSLNLCGPSLMVDSSWNGGIEGIIYAAELVSRGSVKAAIVASASVMYTPEAGFHYYRMGRLTQTGKTKSFSDDAEGYCRSEGSVAFFIQRKEDALRSYGSPMSGRVNFKGSKQDAFSEMSEESVIWYLNEFYKKSCVDPSTVAYVEAAGVASRVVDAAELNGLANIMLPGRKKPLLVGSVKSNLGHTEAASSSVSVAKALIISNSGIIPPNIHYSKPNALVPTLVSGEMKVITEPTPLEGDYIAVNSISNTAGFAHLVIKRYGKVKPRIPLVKVLPPDGLPRLFLLSGRSENGIKTVLQKVEEKPIDEEYVALSNHVFKNGIKNHSYRGYTVLNDVERKCQETKAFFTGGQEVKPIWFVFTGMGSQWNEMGTELMKIPLFRRAIDNCQEVLQPKGIDLINIITTKDPTIYNNILNSFVGIAAIQIGLVDILNEVGIKPDGMVGHSVGELGCAYADGCFTAEQMILAAYARGKASVESNLIDGLMAAVGCGYNNIKSDVPEGIEVACHNSGESCTLSGPSEKIKEYVGTLVKQKIFAKMVNCANIAYHSRYIRPAAPALLRYLKEVIPEPKLRSSKWISSSVPRENWDKEEAKYSSAEYHTNNLLGSVLFEEASAFIPKDAIIIEIAPHGLLQAILKRAFPDAVHIPLTNRSDKNGLIHLFSALGKLYLEGTNLQIEKLYPPVEFPVSRGTPSLNDLVIWNHSEQWKIGLSFEFENYDPELTKGQVGPRNYEINLTEDDYKYLSDHKIFYQTVIPLSYFIDKVLRDYKYAWAIPDGTIKMQDICLKRHFEVIGDICKFHLSLAKGTGFWEVCKDFEGIACGEMSILLYGPKNVGSECQGTFLSGDEVYSYFSNIGHDLGPAFRLIKSATLSLTDVSAVVLWNGNLVTFLNAILTVPTLLDIRGNELLLVSQIDHLIIDFSQFDVNVKKEVLVSYNSVTGLLLTEGLEMLYPKITFPKLPVHPFRCVKCEELKFVPYEPINIQDVSNLLDFTIKVLLNNVHESELSSILISAIQVQDGINLDDLFEILRWRSETEVNVKIAGTDASLKDYLVNPKKEYCLILSDSCQLENSMQLLTSARGGLILLKGVQPTPELAIIFSHVINNNQYFLCRPKRGLTSSSRFINIFSETWKEGIKSELLGDNKNIVFLVKKESSLVMINDIIEECNKLENSHLLRYIFIDGEINEFDPLKHKAHLEKDLKVNILKDGVWGTALNYPLGVEPSITTKPIYHFTDLRCDKPLELKALSLNVYDVVDFDKKVSIFEYSGVCSEKNVCGFAKFSESSRTLHLDPIFTWNKPNGWTHEEAAVVLLPYTVAYYVLNNTCNILSLKRKGILVHQGLLPLCQAVIRVALANNLLIFTSYNNEQEKLALMKIFPEIPPQNFVDCSNNLYPMEIIKETEGLRLAAVVNTLTDSDSLRTSVASLGIEGVLCQINENPIVENHKIGMLIFLNQVAVYGTIPNVMLDLHDSIKAKVHKDVEEGFKSGIIKPLSYTQLPPNVTNIEAESLLRENSVMGKKIVISMDKRSNLQEVHNTVKCSFKCKSNASYIIIGDKEGFWLDLTYWLMKRGACTVHIVANKNLLPGVVIEKLRYMQLTNPHFKAMITPDSRMATAITFKSFIEEVNADNTLDAIFVVKKISRDIIEHLNEILPRNKVIVISEGAPSMCEKRIQLGMPTLAISVPETLLASHILLPRLDEVMCSSWQRVLITEQIVNRNLGINSERICIFQHLPTTVNEVIDLARSPKLADWKEVKTSCPKSRSCLELPPIFVIPPLKKGQLDCLIKSLFHPTFLAVIPDALETFEDLAQQLYMSIKRFDIGVYTLVCSDWSWLVGILLGRLLEADDKTVTFILIESAIDWNSSNIFPQVQSMIFNEHSFTTLCPEDKQKTSLKLMKAFGVLKNRLNLLLKDHPPQLPKLKGQCHYMRPNQILKQERINQVQNYYDKAVEVYTSEEFDFTAMLQNRDFINYINTHILFEYKDAAVKMEKPFIKDCIYKNPRLSYLNFKRSSQDPHQSGPMLDSIPL